LTVVPSAVIPKVIVYQPLSMVVNALFYSGDIGVQVDAIRTLTERPTAREVIGRNGFNVDGKLLPCEVLLKVVNGEHVRGPFGSEVRGRAARGVAIWMGNKSPGNHDAVGGNVWFGVDGLIKWFRKGYGKGVGVVRAIGRVKGGKRGRGGEKKGGEWEYVEGELGAGKGLYDLGYELDEEHKVRVDVLISVVCIRAKDKYVQERREHIEFASARPVPRPSTFAHTFTRASVHIRLKTTWALARMSHLLALALLPSLQRSHTHLLELVFFPPSNLAHARFARRYTPTRCAEFAVEVLEQGLEKGGVSLEAEVLAKLPSEYVEELAEVARNVDLSRDTALAFLSLCYLNCAGAAVFNLMELAHNRLEGELYLCQLGEGEGKPWVASACISALCSLGLLRKCAVGAGGLGGGEEGEVKKSDLASMGKFYEGIYENFEDTDIRAAAAQAYCMCECVLDGEKRRGGEVDPVRLLNVLEWLLSKMEATGDDILRSILGELMYDCCSGKIAANQRASIYSLRGFRTEAAMDWINNGPLGCPCGDEQIDLGGKVKTKVNNGCREGLRLMKKAGDEETWTKKKWEVDNIKRVALFAGRLWRGVVGTELEGKGLNHLWQLLWPAENLGAKKGGGVRQEGGCNALMRAEKEGGWGEGGEVGEEDDVKIGKIIYGMEAWRDAVARAAEDDKERRARAKLNFDHEMERFKGGRASRPSQILTRDLLWQAGAWAASAALQRKKEQQPTEAARKR